MGILVGILANNRSAKGKRGYNQHIISTHSLLPSEQNSVNMKMEAIHFSKTLEQTEHTTWYKNSKDDHHLNNCGNL
jgi:hypothetical protein